MKGNFTLLSIPKPQGFLIIFINTSFTELPGYARKTWRIKLLTGHFALVQMSGYNNRNQ